MAAMAVQEKGGSLSYQETLEAIGYYFDQRQYRGIFIAQASEGYIAKARRATGEAELEAEGFSFPVDDLAALVAAVPTNYPVPEETAPLCPLGYSVFLRAVGMMLDRNQVRSINIHETIHGFILGFSEEADAGKPAQKRLLLDRASIDDLVRRAELA